MPETITKPHELEELQEQQRGTAQIRQSEALTMAGHIRSKLRLGRQRLQKTWEDAEQLPKGGTNGEVDDDMQLLARDVTFNEFVQPKQEAATAAAPAPAKSRWPYAAALALGMGVPATTGIVMAPTIIDAFKDDPPAITMPDRPEQPEYAPILLPGKPQGVQ